MKICTKCKIEKENTEFHKCSVNKDGLYKWCKLCKIEYDKEYRKSDKIQNLYKSEKYREKKKIYEQNRRLNSPEIIMFTWIKNRAKRMNIPFNLNPEDIIIPEKCPLLEIPIFIKPYKEKGSFCPNSPSLDKIIPELGYIKGNIMVISMKANIMKSNASIEELKIFSKNIQKLY